ncbi:hypothetical protein D9M68_990830 [compost metagenome]
MTTLSSAYAIASLWAAHQGLLDIASVDPMQAECALVLRRGLEVEVSRTGAGATAFIRGLGAGVALGQAVGAALAIEPGFDLGTTLAQLLAGDAITQFTLDSGSQSQ